MSEPSVTAIYDRYVRYCVRADGRGAVLRDSQAEEQAGRAALECVAVPVPDDFQDEVWHAPSSGAHAAAVLATEQGAP